MWSQLPTWFIFAAALLGCACIVTVLYLARDTDRRLQGLFEENDRKLEEHDQAFGQLEGRVEDMAGRLFNAATERRDLSRSNQKLSADLRSWSSELKTAREGLTAQEREVARLRDQEREVGDRIRMLRTTIEERDQSIAALQAELAGRTRQIETFDRQRAEGAEELRDLAERARTQRSELEEKDKAITGLQADLAGRMREVEALERLCAESEEQLRSERIEHQERAQRQAETQGTMSARIAELEATLLVRERALQESASEARAMAQSRQEIAARAEQQAEEILELHRRAVELETTGAARASELERDLAQRDHELRERAATIESLRRASTELQLRAEGMAERCRELEEASRGRSAGMETIGAELETLRREASAARERCEALERQVASHTEEALEKERDERERERAWAARVSDLEAEIGRRETAWHERSASFESVQRDVDQKVRELAAARARCEELERQMEQGEERARGAQETQSALCLRVSELEGDLAKLQGEAGERAALLARLEDALAARDRELESARSRCHELDRELRRLLDEEQERHRREIEVEASHRDQIAELEAMLRERAGELDAQRAEQTLLSARTAAVAAALEAAKEELRDREHRLAEAEERWSESRRQVERIQAASELERAPIDPLVEGRILPLFKRGGAVSTELVPDGYLSGLEEGDLDLAMRNLFGGAEPLSAPAMSSLAGRWLQQRNAWKQASFPQQAVYLWADGIFVKAGLREEEQALLVVFAAFADGSRSVVAVETGRRESKDDWLAILRDLERRGLGVPRLVVADESLGILEALDEIGWNCARQRCWGRRIDEVVALLPKNRQAWGAEKLRLLTNAESRAEAKELRDQFVKRCGVRNAAAAERLCEDWRQMTSFYAFPKGHWPHLRTANVVESPFVAIRLRSAVSRPCPEATSDTESMLWKLLVVGENTFRKLNAPLLLQEVARGDAFVDGLPDERSRVRAA